MELARLESRNRGVAALPLAVVPHPLGGIGKDEVLRKVDAAMDSVVRALCVEAAAPFDSARGAKA